MEDKKFIPVGQISHFGLRHFLCVEKNDFPFCLGCSLIYFCDNVPSSFIGPCFSFLRPDGKSVIFLECDENGNLIDG